MLKYTCVLLLSAVALCAQPTVATTGVVGIADAQTGQLNLLNPGVLAPALGVICTAAVEFVDASGTVLKSTTLSVPPGQSKSFQIRSDIDLNLSVVGDRREIRAVIAIPGFTPSTGATTPTPPACKLIATLEVFDTVTGRTLVTLGHVETIPAVVAAP